MRGPQGPQWRQTMGRKSVSSESTSDKDTPNTKRVVRRIVPILGAIAVLALLVPCYQQYKTSRMPEASAETSRIGSSQDLTHDISSPATILATNSGARCTIMNPTSEKPLGGQYKSDAGLVLPPIDKDVPDNVETATFALG
jgi:hypothetical protein